MRIPRIYSPSPLREGLAMPLPREARQHIERVLRLKPGASLTLFDGLGGQYRAELMSEGRARVLAFQAEDIESPLSVRLIQGISKGERMDVTLQKATELGAHRLSPVTTTRSVVKLDEERAERRIARWSGILQSACEQCGRNTLPQLDELKKLDTLLAEEGGTATRIVLAPEGSHRLAELERPANLEVLIGPEGGLSDDEIEAAIKRGFTPIRLGPRILRTETAGLTLLAAAQTLWGDF
ncbi:MAG: 16S rRNA (uracil(1498)-N(3))-methyltransferase [Pseudomonadota bacterium]